METAEIFIAKDVNCYLANCATPIMQWAIPMTSDHGEFIRKIESLLQWLADQGCEEIQITDPHKVLTRAA